MAERTHLQALPLAVVDDDRRATVIACNAHAASNGVRLGHSLNAAIALSANIQFLPRSPKREVDLLREIAALGERYTSVVSLEPPNELLLEVRGSIRLFGGLAALLDRIRADFQERGFVPQLAVSATALGALWIARSTQEAKVVGPRDLFATVGRLPLSTLHWPPETELRLARFGVIRIGDLLRLPRGGLARRIGHRRLAELDRALGRHPDVRLHFKAPERYEDTSQLDFEIETTALLSRFLEKPLRRLQRFLVRRDLALSAVHIDLHHRERANTPLPLGLARATADMSHVARLLQEHLAQLQLPAPVTAISVSVSLLLAAEQNVQPMFADRASAETLASKVQAQGRLLEQLRSRLGDHAVVQLSHRADHRPECAHACHPPMDSQPAPLPLPATLPPRPLWLLREPRRINASSLSKAATSRRVGPEKIEGGWWDGQFAVRDYYRVTSPQGALAWLYRDQTRAGEWRLHGLFG